MLVPLIAQDALVTDPTWIFFLVLVMILCAPLLLRRLHVPPIIGLILAGILVGQYGFNVLARDKSFELFGQVGIYYIMFLAGLELNMGSVIQNGRKGLLFGLLTFCIPFLMGLWASMSLLSYDLVTSLMLSCLFASHTLVSYPIVSRYGIGRHSTVVISVIATAFTTFLSLLLLALVVGSQSPDADWFFWLLFLIKCILYGIVVIVVFPWAARAFLRRYDDSVMQFVFILALVFLGAALAKVAGLEGLLGAFLTGLAINRLIPHASPLMTRLEFVGNALFIPYFLIGVGMIIDVRILLSSPETLAIVAVVVTVGMLSKWIAAWCMTLCLHGNRASHLLMFGLSNSHAAGALAIVMIGTKVGMMDSNLLNATVMLILFSCVVSSFATNWGARQLAINDAHTEDNRGSYHGKCLVTYDHPETVDVLTQLAILIRNPYIHDSLMGLSVNYDEESHKKPSLNAIEEGKQIHSLRHSRMNLQNAQRIAAAADVQMSTLSRVSTNIASGILHTMKEQDVGEVILGMHLLRDNAPAASLGTVVDGVLTGSHREVMVVHITVPPGTIRRIIVIVPEKAQYEVGFYKWIEHLCRLGEQLDCHLIFYGWTQTLSHITEYLVLKHPHIRSACHILKDWSEAMQMNDTLGKGDFFIVVSSRPGFISYVDEMSELPHHLAHEFRGISVMMLYPDQYGEPSEHLTMFAPNGISVASPASPLSLGKLISPTKHRKKKKKK